MVDEPEPTADESAQTGVESSGDLPGRSLETTVPNARRDLIDHASRELARRRDRQRLLELRGQVEREGDLDDM